MKVAIYSRVSTRNHGQDNVNQLRQLRDYCERQSYEIVAEYIDEASGSHGDRVQFKRLFEDAHRHLGARDVLLDQDVTAGARGEPHRAPEVGATTDDGDADARALAIRLDDDGER